MCEGINELPQNVMYYGKVQELPQRIKLHAGPLSMFYEEGCLRCIRLCENEIVRAIYVAVRDPAWGTITPEFDSLVMDVRETCFNIQFDARNRAGEIDFSWKGEIVGSEIGTLEFKMCGTASSTFLKNRIGFCVLHPSQECSGKKCIVEDVEGRVENGKFPENISPHQPFKNMRSISYEVVDGVKVRLAFEGDVFEMEDQRNWTDASFKTYCTPLDLPFPVLIEQGAVVKQSVTLSVEGDTNLTDSTTIPLRFGIDSCKPKLSIPRIGFLTTSHNEPLSNKEVQLLQKVNPAHLRVDIELAKPECMRILGNSIKESRGIGIPLEVAIHLSDRPDTELPDLVGFLALTHPEISSFIIFNNAGTVASSRELKMVSEPLKGIYPFTPIGTGSNVYFADLNRSMRIFDDVDFLSYPVTPQVHASDNWTLVENLSAQADTVKSIRNTTKVSSIHITPITLKTREVIKEMAATIDQRILPSRQVDERQMSLFGAAWTLGSLKYLAETGVDSITCYETTGMLGIVEIEKLFTQKDRFKSFPGCVFPMYHIFADFGEFVGGNVIPTSSTDSLSVDGIVIERDGVIRIILANMTNCNQEVSVDISAKNLLLRYLDATNCEYAMKCPDEYRKHILQGTCTNDEGFKLNISPYGIVRVDIEENERSIIARDC